MTKSLRQFVRLHTYQRFTGCLLSDQSTDLGSGHLDTNEELNLTHHLKYVAALPYKMHSAVSILIFWAEMIINGDGRCRRQQPTGGLQADDSLCADIWQYITTVKESLKSSHINGRNKKGVVFFKLTVYIVLGR